MVRLIPLPTSRSIGVGDVVAFRSPFNQHNPHGVMVSPASFVCSWIYSIFLNRQSQLVAESGHTQSDCQPTPRPLTTRRLHLHTPV